MVLLGMVLYLCAIFKGWCTPSTGSLLREEFNRDDHPVVTPPPPPPPVLQSLDGGGQRVPTMLSDARRVRERIGKPNGNVEFSQDGERYSVIAHPSINIFDKHHTLLHTHRPEEITREKGKGGEDSFPFKGGIVLSNYYLAVCRSEAHRGVDDSDLCRYHNTIEVFTDSLVHKRSIPVTGINAALIGIHYTNDVWYACFEYDREFITDPVQIAVCEMYTPLPITIQDVREKISIDINQESSDANQLDPDYMAEDGETDDISEVIQDRDNDPIVLLPTKWTIRRRYDIRTSKLSNDGASPIRFSMDTKKHLVYLSNNRRVCEFYHNLTSPSMRLLSVHSLLLS
jgi:hypothetical protein